ncbi:MAG: exosortase K [Myxococcota bacterium]
MIRGARARAKGRPLVLVVGAGLAFGLKAFYAEAGADALGFVLAPTARLVEAISGIRFEAEAGVGYVSRSPAYLIAPACAGLNFTIAAFSAQLMAFVSHWPTAQGRWRWLAIAAGLAAVATPVVNAARIALDLALAPTALPAWLSRADLHRIEGVFVYLGTLVALHGLTARMLAEKSRATGPKRFALPFLVYLGVVLGVPWLRGRGAHPDFAHHATLVLAVWLLLAGLALIVACAGRRRLRRFVSFGRARGDGPS